MGLRRKDILLQQKPFCNSFFQQLLDNSLTSVYSESSVSTEKVLPTVKWIFLRLWRSATFGINLRTASPHSFYALRPQSFWKHDVKCFARSMNMLGSHGRRQSSWWHCGEKHMWLGISVTSIGKHYWIGSQHEFAIMTIIYSQTLINEDLYIHGMGDLERIGCTFWSVSAPFHSSKTLLMTHCSLSSPGNIWREKCTAEHNVSYPGYLLLFNSPIPPLPQSNKWFPYNLKCKTMFMWGNT